MVDGIVPVSEQPKNDIDSIVEPSLKSGIVPPILSLLSRNRLLS